MTWATALLAELCEIRVGRTPRRANPEFWGPGEPWLSIADMGQGPVIRSTKEQITPLAAKSGHRVDPGTVLLSFKLSIGKVAIAGVPLYTNEAIAALPIMRTDLLLSEFLTRALQVQDFAGQSNRAAMGATLNKAKLQQIRIPLPTLDEQRRIAAILDHADALRAQRREALDHLDALGQSIFLDTFPVEACTLVSAGELMPSMRNGLSPATSGSYPAEVLTLSAVTQRRFDSTATKTGRFTVDPPPDKRVSALDFLMCRGNGNKALVGVGAFSRWDRPDLVFPDTVIAGRVDPSKITMPYLNATWGQQGVRRQIEALARTTNGTYKVNQQTLSSVMVPLPPLRRQQEFDGRIERVNAQRAAVQGAAAGEDELLACIQSRAFQGEL